MTTSNLLDIWQPDLRQHVVDTAKRITCNKKIQKDLVGHAWFRLGETDAQKTGEYYRRFVTLCMEKRFLLIVYKEVYIT